MSGAYKSKPRVAIGLLICVVLILIAVVAYETWKIADLSNSSDDRHSPSPPAGSTISPPPASTAPPPPPPPPPSGKLEYLHANLTETSVLHIWLKAADKSKEALLYFRKIDAGHDGTTKRVLIARTSESRWYTYWEHTPQHVGQIELAWAPTETQLSYIYAFEPEKVQSDGICPLYISPEAKRPERTASFHFRPPLGWNNDPNGFSRTSDGNYHLFYQHYPHALKWDAMHWGHASSRDMVNWIHQPIFLRPEWDEAGRVAHQYSGAAHAFEDGSLMLFYTDHMEGRDPVEYQRSVVTKDYYRPMGPSRTIIPDLPKEEAGKVAWDFRDPKVFMGPRGAQNAFYMTLGGGRHNRSEGGLVMLYKQRTVGKQMAYFEQWDYQGILYEESRWGTDVCECSSMIPLQDPTKEDTPFVLMYGMQHSRDPEGRESLSPIIVGQFDGKKFTPMFEQMLDFGSDSYAYQPYYDAGRGEALLIGWLGNHWDGKRPFDAQMTLPRTMKLSIDRTFLMAAPHDKLIGLRDRQLDGAGLMDGKQMELPAPGTVEMEYTVEVNDQELSLQMEHTKLGTEAIVVKLNGAGIEIVTKWDKSVKRIARGAKPNTIRLYIDLDSIELFADNGRWVATLRIPSEGNFNKIIFTGATRRLKTIQMWTLKSTQFIKC